MKRILPFVVMCLHLIATLLFCVYSILDIERYLQQPGLSGIDMLGLGWGYGICLFALAVLGIILSNISEKKQTEGPLKTISCFVKIVFWLLIVVSVIIFYL